ncbi:MAG: hypothetical protein ABFC92_03925 [Rectinema sp.]
MNISDQKLQEFESTLKEIRDAAISDSKLFSDHDFRRAITWLSFGFSIVITAFCVAGHALIGNGDAATTHAAILMFWIFIILLAIGGTIKITLISKIMARKNKTLFSVLRIVYGRGPLAVIIAAIVSIVVTSAFFMTAGPGSLAIPLSAMFISFGVFALDLRIRLPEFRALGWSLLILGSTALFFVQESPWLWGGLVWGGSFFALGVAGLFAMRAS